MYPLSLFQSQLQWYQQTVLRDTSQALSSSQPNVPQLSEAVEGLILPCWAVATPQQKQTSNNFLTDIN